MIKVIKAGFYDTIQDLGRLGYQNYGVPISGVMDMYSAKQANAILNNNLNDAVLEITIIGPKLQFSADTTICITGADISPKINSKDVKNNHIINVKKGDVLTFERLNYGIRCYLAVSGGLQSQLIFGSRSMYKNITYTEKLKVNDELQILEPANTFRKTNSTIKINTYHFSDKVIEVSKGPEFDLLTKQQKEILFSKEFLISKDNNRMAFQLQDVLENNLKPIITSLVLPGTVQLTPSGKLIILMKDCQTTGGYPRILQLKESSINIMAQKSTNHKIYFRLT